MLHLPASSSPHTHTPRRVLAQKNTSTSQIGGGSYGQGGACLQAAIRYKDGGRADRVRYSRLRKFTVRKTPIERESEGYRPSRSAPAVTTQPTEAVTRENERDTETGAGLKVGL